jgi:hypothetical protein
MALTLHDPESGAAPAKSWWRDLTALFHDLFESEEMREQRARMAEARAKRKPQRDPVAPPWLRID